MVRSRHLEVHRRAVDVDHSIVVGSIAFGPSHQGVMGVQKVHKQKVLLDTLQAQDAVQEPRHTSAAFALPCSSVSNQFS